MTRDRKPKPHRTGPSLLELMIPRTVDDARSGKNAVAVSALRDEIQDAVSLGFSLKEIYVTLVDTGWISLRDYVYSEETLRRFGMTYGTFCNRCRSLKINNKIHDLGAD